MSSNPQDVSKMVEIYKKVFFFLVIITLCGIGAAFLKVPFVLALSIALVIILIKSKIVYDAFAHLLVPRTGLVVVFVLTGIFFITILILPVLNAGNHLVGTVDLSKEVQSEKPVKDAHGH